VGYSVAAPAPLGRAWRCGLCGWSAPGVRGEGARLDPSPHPAVHRGVGARGGSGPAHAEGCCLVRRDEGRRVTSRCSLCYRRALTTRLSIPKCTVSCALGMTPALGPPLYVLVNERAPPNSEALPAHQSVVGAHCVPVVLLRLWNFFSLVLIRRFGLADDLLA